MLLRLPLSVCLIFASLLSLGQESGTVKPRVPRVPAGPGAFSKAASIFVVGEVHTPTGVVLEKNRRITVMDALELAEGANPTANLHGAKIIRKGENGPTEIPVDIRKILAAKASDVALQAGDVLFIPRGKSPQKKRVDLYYDVAPSAPLPDAVPTYFR
jgi:hypothetical protein